MIRRGAETIHVNNFTRYSTSGDRSPGVRQRYSRRHAASRAQAPEQFQLHSASTRDFRRPSTCAVPSGRKPVPRAALPGISCLWNRYGLCFRLLRIERVSYYPELGQESEAPALPSEPHPTHLPGVPCSRVRHHFVFGRLGTKDPGYFSQLKPLQIIKCLATLQIPGRFPAFLDLPVPGVLNGSFWTIPLEFMCYLVVPIAGMSRLLTVRWLWPCLLAILLAVPEATVTAMVQPLFSPGFRNLVPGFFLFLPAFLAGICFYHYQDRIRFTKPALVLASLSCLLCLGSLPAARIGLPLAGGYLLFAFAFANIPALHRVDQRVDLSYEIYLYHWPCQLLILANARWMSPWLLFLASLGCAVLLARLSWHLIEQPALRLKPRRAKA